MPVGLPSAIGGAATTADGLLESTVRDIHARELKAARVRCLFTVCLWLVTAICWWMVGRRLLQFSTVVAMLTVSGLMSAIEWRRIASIDPVDPQHRRTLAQRAARADAWLVRNAERLTWRRARVTGALVAAISVVWLMQAFTDLPASITAAGLVKPLVRQGQWWRLLTSAFLHGSSAHWLMNSTALLSLGRWMEAYQPRGRLLIVYVLAVIAGGLASLWLLPNASSVGASAGIVGLAAYLLVLAWRRPNDVPPGLLHMTGVGLLMTGLVGGFGFQHIDNAGHIGGALAGALAAWLMLPDGRRPADLAPDVIDSPASLQLGTGESLLAAFAGTVLLTSAGLAAVHIAPLVKVSSGVWTGAEPGTRPITGIRATVGFTMADDVPVTIQNLRNVPLEGWVVATYREQGDINPIDTWREDFCGAVPGRDSGPLPPGQSRVFLLRRAPGATALVASIRMVLFSDLAFEGSPSERDRMLAQREVRASDLTFSIETIRDAAPMPEGAREAFLGSTNASRRRRPGNGRRPSTLRSRSRAREAIRPRLPTRCSFGSP